MFSVNTTVINDNNHNYSDRINVLIDSLTHQAEELQNYLSLSTKARKRDKSKFLEEHQIFLTEVIDKLRNVNLSPSSGSTYPHSSTPYRNLNSQKSRVFTIGSPLANSGSSFFHV